MCQYLLRNKNIGTYLRLKTLNGVDISDFKAEVFQCKVIASVSDQNRPNISGTTDKHNISHDNSHISRHIFQAISAGLRRKYHFRFSSAVLLYFWAPYLSE